MKTFRRLSRGIAIGGSGALAVLAGVTDISAAENIAEIIVTAQKRAENLQEVPVSISVVGNQQLQDFHVTQLADVAGYVPGFQVDSTGSPGQTLLTLRGVAPVGPGQTVGTYIDETPVGSSSFYARGVQFALDLLPYDIDRLEVLRGPQGTLYGASTMGGLLKYVARAPDLKETEFRAGAEVSSIADADDMGYGGRVAVNAPLVDGKFAVRASYAYQLTPGYIDNPVLGLEDQNEYTQDGGRLAFLWQLSDAASLKLSGVWQSIDTDGNASEVYSLPPDMEPLDGGRTDTNVVPQPFTKDLAYYSATLDWDLGWASFISATSYSDTDTVQVQDGTPIYGIVYDLFAGIPDGVAPFTLSLGLEKWTQEFRLSSDTEGKVEWLVGAFYTDEDSSNHQVVRSFLPDGTPIAGLDPLADLSLPSTYQEYAFFGDFTYKFTDRFDVTVGARWSKNDQEFAQVSAGGPLVPEGRDPGKSSEDVWTYMVSPRLRVDDDTMIYARVASGYRPGGPNVALANAPTQVDSDSLVNYEVGMKTEFMDRRAYIDVAAFFMDWEDIQLTVSRGGVSFLDNAGTAESKGLELTAALMPSDGLRLGLNAAYTDAQLTEDVPPPGSGLDGDRLPRVPEWSGSLTVDYTFPIGSLSGRVGGGYRYVDERLSAVESDSDAIPADSYTALDLNAGLSSDRWSLRLFVRNATDEDGVLTSSITNNALNQPQYVSAVPLQPRTIGLSLDVTF